MGKKGFTLVELLAAIGVMLFIAAIAFKLVAGIMQRARVVSAKAQIAQIAQLLESVRDDTSFYPVALADLTSQSPPSGMERGWKGPYSKEVPSDPWQTAYFYQIPSTGVFESPPVIRGRGQPYTYTFSFEASAQTARMRVENYRVSSAQIWVNGTRIFRQQDFNHRPPQPQVYKRDVALLDGGNTLSCWIASQPTSYFIINIYGDFPTDEYFILGSYGKDKEDGAKGLTGIYRGVRTSIPISSDRGGQLSWQKNTEGRIILSTNLCSSSIRA